MLAYTVFGHLSDDSLHKVIAKLDGVQHVFIAEVMNVRDLDKNTSSNYDVPARFHSVFFRSVEDYEKILGRFKFRFVQSLRKPYHCYPTAKMDILHFEYCPPPKVLTFPQDLANPNIDFDGIYDDGWVADRFSVRLSPSSSQLTLAGMNPGLHAPLEVRVEGKMQIANAGDFQLVFEVDRTADHAGWIRVETNSLARLPNNDGRHVGFLLRQIGFET